MSGGIREAPVVEVGEVVKPPVSGVVPPRLDLLTVSSIPLVAVLWEHQGFGGRRRIVVENVRYLSQQGFEDLTSAIGLHKGPSYDAVASSQRFEPTAGFYQNANHGGASLVLGWGEYYSIGHLFNFNEAISSVKFNPTKERFPESEKKPHPFTSIPLVVELYKDPGFGGQRVTVIEDIYDIGPYLGSDWNDVISSIIVKKGPNYVAGKKVELDRDVGGRGGGVALEPGTYSDLATQFGFSDVVSSIKFI